MQGRRRPIRRGPSPTSGPTHPTTDQGQARVGRHGYVGGEHTAQKNQTEQPQPVEHLYPSHVCTPNLKALCPQAADVPSKASADQQVIIAQVVRDARQPCSRDLGS